MNNNKTLTIKEYELPIVIQKETGGGFTAYCSQWKDCYAQGDMIEEVINEVSYVASSLIELYEEEGMKIPLKLKKTSQKSARALKLTFPLIVSSDQYAIG
ncbi:hypothetical protein A3D80_03970 [Candidatus Roizmanbacteria bacterium RIFCSPHIGHO2_02_FULL_40_13b]|uniref:HicB-like antitoxin of toxin-antitoxin system domain-containing protein n=1 Tax=Candidatus Roizmanbacteria bacterium RIFCSPHIGHO2_01_FULL_39_24 TaxID=1802032 RepID=A0A1F7GJZ2_9BACT|nr:MAG: hypothetical protein A2799_03620 [Candidatus Roizmanbacteria bacterium RIFCSPHIGHO2_01_FULL_39_24]OGK27950.1 MAG: hypothetical protein A3D80_03970 [Candidatus Roizmanbacteria bacterium RIFCSPHIGHO2_02_FULL_40_13b]OGK49386.1 MAG: hypothetical protein A3A56_04330 [Candidatus Roizmanbacteria bacterium RIFCSPLOWO2_01_FULL_40_32]OGK56367.1 MAG: hypothetical protein A3H83_02565 [Candidatus Roizmanbacteria bacterium RIFCSPLOWO2_02_FULL_39_8]